MNYNVCTICGGFADDGGLKNSEFACHSCLDQEVKREGNHE